MISTQYKTFTNLMQTKQANLALYLLNAAEIHKPLAEL